MIDCNEWKTEKRHECANMGKVKRLELWWQLYRTSLLVRDLENFRPMDFCWTECTTYWHVKLPWPSDKTLLPQCMYIVLQCDIFILIQPTESWILIGYWELLGGRDSSAGIATRYDLNDPEFESMWERGFPWTPRPTLRPTQPPVQGVLCHSQGPNGQGVELSTHLLLAPGCE